MNKLHVDIAGPFLRSAGGAHYFALIVDDCTKFTVVNTMPKKSDAAEFVKFTVQQLQKKYEGKVHTVRSDNDNVFLSNDMKQWFHEQCISHEVTSTYSPQENGHAERAIQTLAQIRDALMSDAGLAKKYWADALHHATYLKNISSSTGSLSPWELLKGKKPDISNLRIWGCDAWIRVPSE